MTSVLDAREEVESVSATLVEEALRAFSKAFRAWQLYLPNNPTRERAVSAARAAFSGCWANSIVPVRLHVREAELVYDGVSVLREAERPTDGIAWLLYRDGLRELTISPGFESADLETLLGVLQRARQSAPDDDDVITMLWLADLPSLNYRYVEVGSAYELPAASGPAGAHNTPGDDTANAPMATPLAEAPAFNAGAPPAMVRMEDFDSTLFFLDQRELAYLQEEVRAEFGSDPRREVLTVLFDILELQTDPAIRSEVIDRLDELLVNLLSSAAYELVAYALREARVAEKRAPELDPQSRARLLALADRLSDAAVVSQLLQAVDEGTRAPGAETLEALVAELRGSALAPLLAWLTNSSAGPARASVERAVLRLAERQTSDVVRLLDDDDAAVSLGAIRLAGRLRTSAAVGALGRLLRAPDASVRLEVALSLAGIASLGALQALEVALDDTERDVRVAALRAFGTQRHVGALARLSAAIRRKELRAADRSEKTALFDAFGALCGDDGVPQLDAVLNGRSLLGPKESSETRACAARALGLVGTDAAWAALRKSANTRDAVVRNEIARALRGGTGT